VRAITSLAFLLPLAAAVTLTALSPAGLAIGSTAQPKSPAASEPIVVRVDDGGFRWGDAGIGAAAGFGVALVLAGSLALAGRRDRGVDHPVSGREGQLRESLGPPDRTAKEGRRD
jgi:hypothetical protein